MFLFRRFMPLGCLAAFFSGEVFAGGLTDQGHTGAGIAKSYLDQIGPGQGDYGSPYSSSYVIARDAFRAIRRGRQLFNRKFTASEGLGPRRNDGMGDIRVEHSLGAGLGDSCAACHAQPRGSAGFGGSVFTRPDHRDAPHLFGLGLVEILADEITRDLRALRDRAIAAAQDTGAPVTQALASKGIEFGRITAAPDGSVDTTAVQGVDPDLRVRPFFAEGRTISIREFTVGALNAEMGLQSPDPVLVAASGGSDVTTLAGMVLSGSTDRIEAPPVAVDWEDGDADGVVNEVPPSLIDYIEFYLLNYFRPATYRQTRAVQHGSRIFDAIGCTRCHVPNLTIENDRRVADVKTEYDPERGGLNSLFATVAARFEEHDDGSGHWPLMRPRGGKFVVEGIYADFRRHDLGPGFWERNFDGSWQREFMTEPLWGVGSTPPYGHDGRSINLNEVILRHGGEAQSARNRYAKLAEPRRQAVLAFLNSLVLFPPDDTASTLDPGDPSNTHYPQVDHGSIALFKLFRDQTDPE